MEKEDKYEEIGTFYREITNICQMILILLRNRGSDW